MINPCIHFIFNLFDFVMFNENVIIQSSDENDRFLSDFSQISLSFLINHLVHLNLAPF